MRECDWKIEEAKKAIERRFAFPKGGVSAFLSGKANVLEIVQCGVCLILRNRVRSTAYHSTSTVTTSAGQ